MQISKSFTTAAVRGNETKEKKIKQIVMVDRINMRIDSILDYSGTDPSKSIAAVLGQGRKKQQQSASYSRSSPTRPRGEADAGAQRPTLAIADLALSEIR